MIMRNMTPDPVDYPKIKIGNTEYEVKFRSSDLIRLKKEHSIDLTERITVTGVEAVQRTLYTLQAGIAHQQKLEFDVLADLIPWDRIVEVNVVIQESISKLSAQALVFKPRTDALVQNLREAKKILDVVEETARSVVQ